LAQAPTYFVIGVPGCSSHKDLALEKREGRTMAQNPHIEVRNTFIHVRESDDPDVRTILAQRESTSDPSSRSSSVSSSNRSESPPTRHAAAACSDAKRGSESAASSSRRAGGNSCTPYSDKSGRVVSSSASEAKRAEPGVRSGPRQDGSADKGSHCRRQNARPGKNQRDAYKKFRAKVTLAMRVNVNNFDMDNIKLPHYIEMNEALRKKVLEEISEEKRHMQGYCGESPFARIFDL